MGMAPIDNLNNMEVWDKFDLSRIVIWNNVGWQMILVAEVTCVAKRFKVQGQSYILYNLSVMYYLLLSYRLLVCLFVNDIYISISCIQVL